MTSSHDHDGEDPSPNPIQSAGSGGQMEMGEQQEASYTCRRCRTELFTEGHLERHATGAQAIVRRKKGDLGGSGGCTSLFLSEAAMESLPWLQAALAAAAADEEAEAGVVSGGVEGKLCCPNVRCRTRLGGFNWSGSQCSCGSWVVPALQVVASRVDRKGREETSGMLVVDFVAAAAAAATKAGGEGGKEPGQESAGGGGEVEAAAIVS